MKKITCVLALMFLIDCAVSSSPAQAQYLLNSPSQTSDNTVNAGNGIVAMTLDANGSGSFDDALDTSANNGAGLFAFSQNGYGSMGSSVYGTSLWASSSFSGNTSPTVVIQSVGPNSAGPDADLLQVQDQYGSPELIIRDSGLL